MQQEDRTAFKSSTYMRRTLSQAIPVTGNAIKTLMQFWMITTPAATQKTAWALNSITIRQHIEDNTQEVHG